MCMRWDAFVSMWCVCCVFVNMGGMCVVCDTYAMCVILCVVCGAKDMCVCGICEVCVRYIYMK